MSAWESINKRSIPPYILSFLLLFFIMSNITITAQTAPHTFIGYAYYGTNSTNPAADATVDIFNIDQESWIHSADIVDSKGKWQVNIGSPSYSWSNDEKIKIYIIQQNQGNYYGWNGSIHTVIDMNQSPQIVKPCYLTNPSANQTQPDEQNNRSTNETNTMPVAKANGPYTESVNLTIFFNASESTDADGRILSYTWSFGDGITDTGKTTTHIYTTKGKYNVTLLVEDDAGKKDIFYTQALITQENRPPSPPIINGPKKIGQKRLTNVSLRSTDPDDDHMFYFVDWGDNSSEKTMLRKSNTETILTHSWNKTGFYRITAHAIDMHNASSEKTIRFIAVNTNFIHISDMIHGYLLDYKHNKTFSLFYNVETNQFNPIEQRNNTSYLIDSDADGNWDYIYDTNKNITKLFKLDNNNQIESVGVDLTFIILIIVTISIHLKMSRKHR